MGGPAGCRQSGAEKVSMDANSSAGFIRAALQLGQFAVAADREVQEGVAIVLSDKKYICFFYY